MSERYPDYQKDSDGEIPEPFCYDLIRMWPEHGGAYLWDMNGVCICIASITDNDADEPLDIELDQWQGRYEWKPLNEEYDPTWDSEEEQKKFDEDGAELAHKVFDFFGRARTVIYYPTLGGELRLDALGKPPIRI